jgi:hypothetical protein
MSSSGPKSRTLKSPRSRTSNFSWKPKKKTANKTRDVADNKILPDRVIIQVSRNAIGVRRLKRACYMHAILLALMGARSVKMNWLGMVSCTWLELHSALKAGKRCYHVYITFVQCVCRETLMSDVTAECMGFAEMRESGFAVRMTGTKEERRESGRGVVT